MMTPTHLLGGYLSLQLSKKFWASPVLTSAQTLGLLVFGLILSIGIDLDVLFTNGITGHHQQLTHYPFFWLLLSLAIFGLGFLFKQRFIQSLAIVTFVSSWTHLTLDLVGVTMGIHLLWPFTDQEFSVTPLKTDFASNQERWNYIMHSPVMWIGDFLVIITGLIKLITDLYNR